MQQVVWSFYEKPMNSPYVIMGKSAMPMKIKITTMVQEVWAGGKGFFKPKIERPDQYFLNSIARSLSNINSTNSTYYWY